jgi:hypothetical protein
VAVGQLRPTWDIDSTTVLRSRFDEESWYPKPAEIGPFHQPRPFVQRFAADQVPPADTARIMNSELHDSGAGLDEMEALQISEGYQLAQPVRDRSGMVRFRESSRGPAQGRKRRASSLLGGASTLPTPHNVVAATRSGGPLIAAWLRF